MVVIKISYPHQQPRYGHYIHPTSSASVSPTLTDSSSEPLPSLLQVSSDGDTLATSKQEEWITKRKTELVTTKQIETRVKRQLVLEDGKVVEDTGPLVTTTTTEDTDKNESEHTEHKSHGDDQPLGEGWVAVEGVPEDAVVKETNEKKVTTHDEVEDILETEEVQHYGDMTNRNIARSIRGESDGRLALRTKDRNELFTPLSPLDRESSQKRIVNQSRRHDRTTDIEDTKEVSKLNEIGNLVTEITRRHEHEEFHNEDIPDSDSDEFEHIENRIGSRDYNHSKDEDLIEYISVPKGGNLSSGRKEDIKNRHEDVMRSLNSQIGRGSFTKSGSRWDEDPPFLPTPPPRTRRRNSPDIRNVRTPDHTANVHQVNTMNYNSRRNTSSTPQEVPSYLQKTGDTGERKAYERREQSFGYTGPGQRNLSRDALDSGDSGYVTKHNNYYKTEENNNPAQTTLYKNGDAEVTERKTVERREKVFSYDGASQKQFHPKYIVGTASSTMGRLRGVEGTGAILEENRVDNRTSQTMPRRRFYFGDEEGSLLNKHAALEPRRSSGARSDREQRFGADDINVSISNKFNSANNTTNSGKTSGLSRSMSFTPRSLSREKAPPLIQSPTLAQIPKSSYAYKSNPHLVESPDLLSPRLISLMSRSVRDVNSVNSYNSNIQNDVYSNRRDTTNVSRSKRTFLENVKKNSPDLNEPISHRAKASSPARSMTPTNYSPTTRNDRTVASRSLNSPLLFGGTNSPLSDDYHETYRMTNSTPDSDVTKPRISTDTTSRFSRKTIRGVDGQPAGKVESSETTTRTKSRFKESEVMYPKGQREGSPASFRSDLRPQMTSGGSVIIPVRDTNNNKSVHYAH